MPQTQKPSIGRIVHYIESHSKDPTNPDEHLPAIIAKVRDKEAGIVSLWCWSINPGIGGHQGAEQAAPYDETATKPGTWHWPEREE